MKQKMTTLIIFGLLLIFVSFNLQAQDNNHWRHKSNKAWPDSLKSVELEGVVLIDTTQQNPYLLDVDDDSIADYRLIFGPDWYQPESGAQRPVAGDTVTIVGAVHVTPQLPAVMVFEINDLVWRDAVENWWRHQDWPDSLETVTVTGTVLVDSSYFYVHYFLDENDDGEPDYFLNFGPLWYQPEGVSRPEPETTVTIEGGLNENGQMPVLIVYTIDGALWREPAGPPPWAGSWIKRDDNGKKRLHCPSDSLSWAEFPPGFMRGGGHHGPQFPDSVFCEFYQMFGDSLPGRPDSALIGYRFHFLNPGGQHVHGKGRMVRFVKHLRLALHFGNPDTTENTPLRKSNLEHGYSLKYWDNDLEQWMNVDNFELDSNKNIFYIEQQDIQPIYAVFKTGSVTNVERDVTSRPNVFRLMQNYPNPFNPTTEIVYSINKDHVPVTLKIYNINGEEIRTLINQSQSRGVYQISWDGMDRAGRAVASGIYLYRLMAGEQMQTKRMILMK